MTRTKQIFSLTAPYNNRYQGTQTRLLFVCSVGMLRSPTAADVASKIGYNTRSCGEDEMALIPLSVNLIEWADKILFMSPENYINSMKNFESCGYDVDIHEKAIRLSIDDDYDRNDPWLIKLIELKLQELNIPINRS